MTTDSSGSPSSNDRASAHRLRTSRRRRSDPNPDVFQPHNRGLAWLLDLCSIGCAIGAAATFLLTREVHLIGLLAANLGLLLALCAVVLERCVRTYSVVGFTVLVLAGGVAGRWLLAWFTALFAP